MMIWGLKFFFSVKQTSKRTYKMFYCFFLTIITILRYIYIQIYNIRITIPIGIVVVES